MPALRSLGGGDYGHIRLTSIAGKTWDSSPVWHLRVLNRQPDGPAVIRQQRAAFLIAKAIERFLDGAVLAEQIFLVFNWKTGDCLEVRVG